MFLMHDKCKFADQQECYKHMQDGCHGEYHDKVQMSVFMAFENHCNQTAQAAAHNCHDEHIFFRDSPAVFDGSFFIDDHCYIQHDIDNGIIAKDDYQCCRVEIHFHL